MSRNFFSKFFFLQALFLVVSAALPAGASAYTLTTDRILDEGGNCNSVAGPVSSGPITEDRSWFIQMPWIGGTASWDDQIGFSATRNGQVLVDAAYPLNAFCRTEGWVGYGWIGQYFLFPYNGGDTDSFTFTLQALQKRSVGSSGNSIEGRVEYGYTRNNCSGGQFTQNDSCQWVNGTISVSPTSCNAPCSPTVSWNGTAIDARIERRINGSLSSSSWRTGLSGSASDSSLSAGSYNYKLMLRDGYGNYYEPNNGNVTVTVTASTPTATLSVSTNTVNLSPSQSSDSSVQISNINATNGGSFTVGQGNCRLTGLTNSFVASCPSSTGSVQITAPNNLTSSYSGNLRITATPQGNTQVSGSPQNVAINYTVAPQAPSAPSAVLNFNDGTKNKTVSPGGQVTYVWSSTNGYSYRSEWSSSTCGTGSSAPVGTSSSGSYTQTFSTSNDACSPYTVTYIVTNSAGTQASDSVTITIGSAPPPPPEDDDEKNKETQNISLSLSANWNIPSTEASSPSKFQSKWDYDNNNLMTSADATFIAQVSGRAKTCPTGKDCDFNGNGSVNIGDALAYANYLRNSAIKVRPGTIFGGAISLSSSEGGQVSISSSPSGHTISPNPVTVPSGNAPVYASFTSPSNLGAGNHTVSFSGSDSSSNTLSFEVLITTPFDYSLSNSGTSNATKSSGDVFTQNTITKTLSTGAAEAVSLSLSGMPTGVSYSISNGTCAPTCASTVTFTVSPSAPTGTHPITVTGAPLGKQTNFNLVISGSPLSASCSHSPASARVGENVGWTASVSGGTPPFTYSWSGTNIPMAPAPSSNPFNITYSTTGQKSASVTVTDSDSRQSTCPASSIQINFDPRFEEF